MNEYINIVEILKDAPKGTKLWSPVCGDCCFHSIDIYNDTIQCTIEDGSNLTILFDNEGRYMGFRGECLLFPSKDNKDWSTFMASWKHKHFKPFENVLVASGMSNTWEPDMYRLYDIKHDVHKCMCYTAKDSTIISYKGNENKLGKSI